jgi:hypothetical protein
MSRPLPKARPIGRRAVLGAAVCVAVAVVVAPERRRTLPGRIALAWKHEGGHVFDLSTGRVIAVSPSLPSALAISNTGATEAVPAGTGGFLRTSGRLYPAVSSSVSLAADAPFLLPMDLAPGQTLVIPLLYQAPDRAALEDEGMLEASLGSARLPT